MRKTWKKIIAACCVAVMLMTLPGVNVLANEFPVEEMSILDMEEDFAEDIMTDNSLEIYDEVSIPEESDAEMPTENVTDESSNAQILNNEKISEDQTEAPVDEIPVQEVYLIEDANGEELCGYTNHSRDEAVAWIKARREEGWAKNYDGVAGIQCVDLIKYYFKYLTGDFLYGSAYQYVGRTDLPSGWYYTSTPSPGDIAVWGAYVGIALGDGHVALVESVGNGTFFYVDVNGATGQAGSGSISNSNPSTFIHPDFPSPVVNISNCTITLSPTSYTYNGSAKSPSVTVKNGSTTLSSGTDYTVSYSNNVNAGTAAVTVTGKGNYTGSATRTFTINKAAATLSFAEGSITKRDLNTTFTNTLTRTTDGTVRFSSSNTAVAIVNAISGQVTTVGGGTATITVTATEGTNYKAASASYTLLVGISVGSNVVATFDENTGTVNFYSSGGELWRDWVDKLGVSGWKIKSIKVKSGTVYLPSDSSGGNDDFDDKMFKGLGDLEELDISRFNTSRVTDMSNMFCGCLSLKNLDLSNFDTSRVKDMSGMFYSCRLLKNLDLSSFDTSNVENMANMFKDCGCLTNLNLSSFSTSKVRDMSWMFSGCENLTDLDLRNFNTSNVTNMRGMFWCCLVLTNLNLSSFNTANVTDMYGMFTSCCRLTNLDLSSFNTANVTDMQKMFDHCEALTNLDLSSFNTAKVTNMYNMFWACTNLTELDLSSFNTANVTNMYDMFCWCRSLTNLNLGSFDTAKVTNMQGMFDNCDSLTELDLSSFNTASVKNMAVMFYNCNSLMSLDLSSFDTSNVTSMGSMFSKCDNLQLLKTPKKQTQSGVVLPDTMYDSADASYTELPLLSKSIVLTKNHSIQSYNLTLSPTSYTYDGNAKKPSVTVKKGTTTLTKNTDYTVAYSKNINAGTAKVTVTGKGSYTGTITKTFTIAKATPTLKFASFSLSKKTGDAAFTNALTKTTDGVVTFKSSDTSVATVNSTSGKVTIKGVGTVAITATAEEGTNYRSGNVSYTLTVTAPSPAGFSDVQDPSHPYYKAIYWAAEAGITKGYSDGTFGINRACTRSEAVMFLWRLAGKPAPVDALSSPFKDVPKSHAHYKAILWAAQKGITKGYSDGTFGINKTCTRGQIMTFIWRFKGQPAPKAAAKSPFSDVPKNHAYYKAILWGSQNKITNGFSDGTFGINKNCTRGQIVTFLYRAK